MGLLLLANDGGRVRVPDGERVLAILEGRRRLSGECEAIRLPVALRMPARCVRSRRYAKGIGLVYLLGQAQIGIEQCAGSQQVKDLPAP